MNIDDVTDEQEKLLVEFQEITQSNSEEISYEFLVTHDWNIERAVNAFFQGSSQPPTPAAEVPSQPMIRSVPQTAVVQRTPTFINRVFHLPLSILYTFYIKLRPFLPWSIANIALRFFRSFIWPKKERTPIEEIDWYCQRFDRKYGVDHPNFYRGLLSQALRDAQREIRILFVYLHDENSPICDQFCREILGGEALRTLVANHLFWSADRYSQEGQAASYQLHANAYPCFCIIAHYGSQRTVLLKIERYSGRDLCLAEIINGIEQAEQTLEHNIERRNRSESRGQLLQEQDAAYQASLQADREKAEQREREANQRRLVEQEEERKRQAVADFRDGLREKLAAEPAETESNTIQVSIRLPDNEPILRRFYRDDSARLLFEFAWTQKTVPDRFVLLCGYPRQRFRYEDIGTQKIGELMNANKETCFLEEIDE